MTILKNTRLSHLSTGLGAEETRTEPYEAYGEGALESATTASAKSSRQVGGFAIEWADAVRKA